MPAIIAAILAALSRLIMSKGGSWFLGMLAFTGLSISTQVIAVGPILDQLQGFATGAGGQAVEWLRFLNFDKAITITTSAITTKYALTAGRAFFKKV